MLSILFGRAHHIISNVLWGCADSEHVVKLHNLDALVDAFYFADLDSHILQVLSSPHFDGQ